VVSYSPSNALTARADELAHHVNFRNFSPIFRPAQFWMEKRPENGQGRRFPHFWPRNPDRSVHTVRASHPEVEETAAHGVQSRKLCARLRFFATSKGPSNILNTLTRAAAARPRPRPCNGTSRGARAGGLVASFVVRPLFTTQSEQRINHAPSVTLATAEYLYRVRHFFEVA